MPGDCAFDQQKIILRIYFNDFQILRGHPALPHMPGQVMPLKDTPRRSRRTNRTDPAVSCGSMRLRTTGPMPPLHASLKTFSFRRAYNINFVSDLKNIDFQFFSDLIFPAFLFGNFPDDLFERNIEFLIKINTEGLDGVRKEKTLKAGIPVIPKSLIAANAMWSVRSHAPIWLILAYCMAVIIVWGVIVKIIRQIMKIREIGKS